MHIFFLFWSLNQLSDLFIYRSMFTVTHSHVDKNGCRGSNQTVVALCFWSIWWQETKTNYKPDEAAKGKLMKSLWIVARNTFCTCNNFVTTAFSWKAWQTYLPLLISCAYWICWGYLKWFCYPVLGFIFSYKCQ